MGSSPAKSSHVTVPPSTSIQLCDRIDTFQLRCYPLHFAMVLPMKRLALTLTLATPLLAQEDAVNPNIGHHHHHHRHGDKHPVEKAGPERFATSREAAAALSLPMEKDAFNFVVFGDRTGGPAEGVSVLADAVRDVNLLEPDFVITVGDLIQGYNEEPQWKRDAEEYKGIMNELACPWFPVAGNHDVYWRGPKGVKAPAGEHEKGYEMEFGPLWYAFEHKNSWFIVLYSDEGNPETGEKNFHKPDCQQMSPEQFSWLDQTLTRAKDANHIFLFLHHPRWIGNNYGDDWKRVHNRLKEAGNVSAVFAGHIHKMRYDLKDGIEYVTLATTGGHQPGIVPDAGYLHHYDIVNVRKDRLAMAAVPVGEVLDVREITNELVEETRKLAAQSIRPGTEVDLADPTPTQVSVDISNPTKRKVDFTVGGDSADSRWHFAPDHRHGSLNPGETRTMSFEVSRMAGSVDDAFRPAYLSVAMDYLAEGFRYSIPERREMIPVAFPQPDSAELENLAVELDGESEWLTVDSSRYETSDSFTLECRFKARSFDERTGLVTKTEGSDYGIFVSNGRPQFSVHVGGSYLSVAADSPILKPQQWYHIAGVYDGVEARLYLDGKLIDRKARKGNRKTNDLPLVIGGDTTKSGEPMSLFAGMIDEVRLSRGARYTGEQVTPLVGTPSEPSTLLLHDFNEHIGPWVPDRSSSRAHATVHGKLRFLSPEQ